LRLGGRATFARIVSGEIDGRRDASMPYRFTCEPPLGGRCRTVGGRKLSLWKLVEADSVRVGGATVSWMFGVVK